MQVFVKQPSLTRNECTHPPCQRLVLVLPAEDLLSCVLAPLRLAAPLQAPSRLSLRP